MTKGEPRNILSLLSILVLGGLTAAVPAYAEDDSLEYHEFDTGIAKRQTVIPGFYLGGDIAEIAVVHIDANDNRILHMFGFDGTGWVSMLEATLPPSGLFVDVANIGGRDRLISYENGRLS